MANPFSKNNRRGFGAFREEAEKRKKAAESKKGKLFWFFLKDKDADVPVRFITDEPILFRVHRMKEAGVLVNRVCTEDEDCPDCMDGHKPQYVGGFLIVDGREFPVDERDSQGNKTGKKKMLKDRLKILARGQQDLAKLDRLNTKWGLSSRPWFVTKVGSGKSTTWEFERGDEDELTPKQIKELLMQLPEKQRDLDPMDIVELQVFGEEEDNTPAPEPDKKATNKVKSGVQRITKKETAPTETTKKGFKRVQKQEEAPPPPKKQSAFSRFRKK